MNEFLQLLRDWSTLFLVFLRSAFTGSLGKVTLIAACCQFWIQMTVLFFAAPTASTGVHIFNAVALVGVHLVAAFFMVLVSFVDSWSLLKSNRHKATIPRLAKLSLVTALVVSVVAGGLWMALFATVSHAALPYTIAASALLGSALDVLAFVGVLKIKERE